MSVGPTHMSTPAHAASPADDIDQDAVRHIASELARDEGPLLPILHEIVERFGHVDEAAIRTVADVLNVSRAEVHGVVSFYHDFRTVPAGRHVVKLCCAEACQSRGSRQLVADVESALGVSVGGTTSDGRVTLEAVYCLGNCALSPAALVDGELYGRVDAERVRQLVSASSQ